MTRLIKHFGTTKDTQGMEFNYICLTHIEGDLDENNNYFETINKEYISKDFENITANTLKELKGKMGDL
jgi:hypothetical protein